MRTETRMPKPISTGGSAAAVTIASIVRSAGVVSGTVGIQLHEPQ